MQVHYLYFSPLGDQIKKNEVGWAYRTYKGEKRRLTKLWWGNPNERDHLEGVILEWVLEKSVDLAQSGTDGRFL